MKQYYPLH